MNNQILPHEQFASIQTNLNSGALRIRELWSSKNQYSGSWKRELWSAKNQNWSKLWEAKNQITGSWKRELWGEETVFCILGANSGTLRTRILDPGNANSGAVRPSILDPRGTRTLVR